MKHLIQAGKFKAECLKVMEQVHRSGISVVVTKRHVPIVKICPIERRSMKLYGSMKDSIHIEGDLLAPLDEIWDADS